MKYVAWKDYKAVTADLKRIYQSATVEEALQSLDAFAGALGRNNLISAVPGATTGPV